MTYQEYLKFIDTLNLYTKCYYDLDNPIASDFEYDRLYCDICEYEDSNPDYISPKSPTQRVGGGVLDFLRKANTKRAWELRRCL